MKKEKLPTHYIDQKFGGALRVFVENSKIESVEDANFKGKLSERLKGLTIDQAKEFIKVNFRDKGVWMALKEY